MKPHETLKLLFIFYYSLFIINYSFFWAFPFVCAQPNPQPIGYESRRLPKGRSPAHTPRFTAKWCIGRAGAPSSLCPSRAPLSCSTCGVFGLRPNAVGGRQTVVCRRPYRIIVCYQYNAPPERISEHFERLSSNV